LIETPPTAPPSPRRASVAYRSKRHGRREQNAAESLQIVARMTKPSPKIAEE
jgi:hypothetical protein